MYTLYYIAHIIKPQQKLQEGVAIFDNLVFLLSVSQDQCDEAIL